MPGGRPLKYETVEQLQKAIDEYFTYCDNRIKQVHSKEGESYGVADPEPYTMAGLAYNLNLSRQGLMEYKHKNDGFSDAIKRARHKIEADLERRMYGRDTFTPGLIFSAKNNFGYKDKTETEQSGSVEVITRKAKKSDYKHRSEDAGEQTEDDY